MRLQHCTVSVFTVPLNPPRADGTLRWDATTVVVVEVVAENEVGVGWTYGPRACAAVIEDLLVPVLAQRHIDDIPGAWQAMVAAVRNAGLPGVCAMAISAVDVALWDLKARSRHVPLVELFGMMRNHVPLYWSGGFTSYSDDELEREFATWVGDRGFRRAKMKIGSTARDAESLRLERARAIVGDDTELMMDANGAYDRKAALGIGRVAADLGVTWFEEPVTSDDREGLLWLRNKLPMRVAAGEYGYDLRYLETMADVVDVLQVDATRCGGFTAWFRVAAVTEAKGVAVSAHTAQSLHVQVAVATPNLLHVEYFADHHDVDRVLFDNVPDPRGGELPAPISLPGHGVRLRRDGLERFVVQRTSVQAAA